MTDIRFTFFTANPVLSPRSSWAFLCSYLPTSEIWILICFFASNQSLIFRKLSTFYFFPCNRVYPAPNGHHCDQLHYIDMHDVLLAKANNLHGDAYRSLEIFRKQTNLAVDSCTDTPYSKP